MHPIGKLSCLTFLTARKRSLGQGKIFRSVCHSVHGGGVYPQEVCIQGVCLQGDLPPGSLPLEGSASSGGLMVVEGEGGWLEPTESEKQVVHILLECFLVLKIFNHEFVQRPGFRVALETRQISLNEASIKSMGQIVKRQ